MLKPVLEHRLAIGLRLDYSSCSAWS